MLDLNFHSTGDATDLTFQRIGDLIIPGDARLELAQHWRCNTLDLSKDWWSHYCMYENWKDRFANTWLNESIAAVSSDVQLYTHIALTAV